jgi:hemerythrin-like domain-containing protein
MGGPRRTAGESIDALEEAITVLRALWAPGRGVTVDGRFYQLAGAHPGPTAPHDIGIWVGSYKPRMLRLTGRLADGWLPSAPYLPPEQLADANAIIDRAAVDAGRDPGAVRRLYNIGGSFAGTGREFLQGPPAVWVEQLAELAVTEGISGFILMTEADGADDLRRFAEEVAPAVRELVAAERTRGAHRPLSTGTADSGFPPGTAGGAGTVTGTPTRSGAPTGTGVATGADASPARRSDPGALGVTPTPDDGRRLSATRLWDESTRPVAPAPDPAISYTDEGRANGQHLVDVHNHLREELAQLRDVVEQVAAGALAVGEARSLLNTMAMRQNNWTLGAFCESYCRVLTTHHTLEDEQMFPGLRRADPGLAPVLDRLEQEHHVIAEVLERVDAALVAMLTEPDGLNRVREAVDLLTDTLLSHLSYEEHQLVEPLSRA